MNQKFSALALITAGLLAGHVLAGCGGTEGDEGLEKETSRYAGVWVTDCESDGTRSRIFERIIGGGKITLKIRLFFSDTTCSTEYWVEENLGNSVLGLEKTLITGEVVNDVDTTFHSKSYTPSGVAGTAQLTSIQACGITDWVDGVKRDVTDEALAGAANCFGPTLGSTFFNIVHVDPTGSFLRIGSMDDPLYDGTTPDKRPITLATETHYKVP